MNSNPLNSSIPTTNSSESDVNVINSSTTRRAKFSSGTETTASNRAEMTAIEEQNSSSLTTKPLEQRAMTSDAIRELFDRNPPTKNLLCLKKQNIGDADVTALVPKLRENNSSGWYLPENHIGDTGVTELAKLLSSKWNLTFLNLNNNPIRDKGAEELAEKLSENITLEILWLKNTQITHKGLTAFVNLLSTNNRTLSALSISSDTINVAKKSDPKIIDDITQLKQLLRRNKDSNFLLNSLKGYLLNSPEIDYLTKGKKLCSMPNFHEVIMLLRHNLNRLTDQIDPLRNGNFVPEQTQPTMLDILLKRRQEIISYSKEVIQALETVFTDPNEEARLLNKNGEHVMQAIKTALHDLKKELGTAFEGNIGFILSKYNNGLVIVNPRKFATSSRSKTDNTKEAPFLDIDVSGDGGCLFHAIALGLQLNENAKLSSRDLRNVAASHLGHNRELHTENIKAQITTLFCQNREIPHDDPRKNQFPGIPGAFKIKLINAVEAGLEAEQNYANSEEGVNDYINHILDPTAWGGEIELGVLAELLQLQFLIYDRKEAIEPRHPFIGPSEAPKVHLLFDGDHYGLRIPKASYDFEDVPKKANSEVDPSKESCREFSRTDYNTLLSSTGKFRCVHEILDMWEASFGEKSCPTWLATSQELATLNNFLSVLKGDKIAPFPTPSAEVLFTSLSNLIEQLTTEQSTGVEP